MKAAVSNREELCLALASLARSFSSAAGILGQFHGQRLEVRRAFCHQLRQAGGLSRLVATRPAKAVPVRVISGTPAHSASLPVVWAL